MKTILTLFTMAAAVTALHVSAMWVRMTDVDLVKQSDLIVQATLVRTEPKPMPGSKPLEIGILKIDEVLKGPAGLREIRLAQPAASGPLSSTDIRYEVNQKGLWFLRPYPHAGDPSLYGADHPQRFLPEAASSTLTHFRNLVESLRK
ncbi:MAG: hypothetical protein V4632_20985 [Pseudomonadota bacterium]